MKGARGIDNPAFVPSSPDTPRRSSASPSQVEVSHAPTEDAQPPKPPEPPPPPPAEPESLAPSQFKEGPFGWGRFTPRSLRPCNTPAGFLLHYCVLAVTQGGHKPRWLAFASFMIGLGALVFSLPQFFSGQYQLGSIFEGTCLARNSTSCAPSRSLLSNYLYVFILGQLLLGVGGTPLYTLGTAFIDESVPTHKASLYIGIGYSMSLLGPAIGYVLGGQLLNIYIDFAIGQSIDVTKDDPRWLGAWWIGFLVSWLFAWSLIIPFSCFPKHLPGTAKVQAEKTSQTHQCKRSSLSRVDQNFGQNIKDFPVALKNLMRNTVFICLILSTSSEALITTGFATFLPKFIENQFGLTSSFAATIGGAVLIPGAALGQILGGAIVSRYKMTCKYAMKFALVTSGVALVLTFLLICAKCENEPFAGVSESYNGTGDLGNLTAPCNANCNCLRSYYYPLCGRDGVQYFSPCFAGCLNYVSNSKPKRYYNCSCIEKKAEITSTESVSFEAKAGKCETHCTNLPVFLGMFFVTVIFTFMAGTPITVSILRCVDQRQRSLALGTQFMLLRLLGTIPGPIIFGATIDSTCTLWDINECGIKGACWVYDNIKMAHMLVAISVTCKIITIFFNGLAVFLYKPPPPGTEVSFQNQNADVTAVSIEQALNKGVNDG
ncbi:solute carrier organic anion transporter family member 4C1 isoform X2 [Cavia porcellus]|uniref:solute carrier organic anion transporter family member 4C1 isoform X2 n=1 Tax=Cavia porcellus TaxID=10141 RepID=UPI002FE25524